MTSMEGGVGRGAFSKMITSGKGGISSKVDGVGGMGTPQGPAGEEEIMASKISRLFKQQNCFLDFT